MELIYASLRFRGYQIKFLPRLPEKVKVFPSLGTGFNVPNVVSRKSLGASQRVQRSHASFC
jgi:hypothetical protein